MRFLPVVASVLSGLVVYLLLELTFGSYGIVAIRAFENFSHEVAVTRESVEDRGNALRTEIQQLQTDSEAVRVAAHDIGLVGPEEGIIRVEGFPRVRKTTYDPGQPAPNPPVFTDNRPLFRGVGVVTALLILLVWLMRGGGIRRERSTLDIYRSERHSR